MQILILEPEKNSPDHTPTSTPAILADPTHTAIANNVDQLPTTPPGAWFSPEINFYLEPEPLKSQRVYPSGIRQIFAIWDYANMGKGLLVRREWYKDGKLILAQEEPWDFSRYGSKGTIADITIHDFEKGLETGLYSLRLYINGQEQTLNTLKDQASFRVVQEESPSPVKSPDGKYTAIVPEPRSLTIYQENGQMNRVFVGQEVARLAWFPDSQNIIVSNRDRSKQDLGGSAEGVREELWIINSESGMRNRIATPDENIHMPLISPDGKFIAAVSGSGRLNACAGDLTVVMIELDHNLTRVAIHRLFDFVGFPDYKYQPIPINHPAIPLPGTWLEDKKFSVALKFPCSSGISDGIYKFNLDTWQVDPRQ
jgi:hypothetical protein